MDTGNYANHHNICELGSHVNDKINCDVGKHSNHGNIRTAKVFTHKCKVSVISIRF